MTDKIKSNFHTHTLLCDGINMPEEMVIAAVDKGFDTLGFSGHCYTTYDESYCMSRENTLKYKTEIARLQEKYRGQLEAYARAVRLVFEKPVIRCVLFFLQTGQSIELRPEKNIET